MVELWGVRARVPLLLLDPGTARESHGETLPTDPRLLHVRVEVLLDEDQQKHHRAIRP
jgi:hypothetical protein